MRASLTVRDPVASKVVPEASVVPVESFDDYLLHHRHVQVDGVVQKQRVDGTLNTQQPDRLQTGDVKLQLCRTIIATVTDMFSEADDALFRRVLYNKAHVLHSFLSLIHI